MKNLFQCFLVLGFLLSGAANAEPTTCELTTKGNARFEKLNFANCAQPDQMFCLEYKKKNGKTGHEYLDPRGCEEYTCYANSPSFIFVWNTDHIRNPGYYVADRADQSLLMTCH